MPQSPPAVPPPPRRTLDASACAAPVAAVLTALLALSALLLGAAGTASAAGASANGGWAVFPTPPPGVTTPGPGDRQYFYLESAPGRTLSDHVSVENLGTKPITFQLHGTMAGVGSWLTLATTKLTVPPRTRADIPFTLSLPVTAEPGDHPGTITVVPTTAQPGSGAVAVRIYLSVTGVSLPALAVTSVTVRGSSLHYTLTNQGNVTLHPRVEMTESGWFGSVYHRPLTDTGRDLLPGQSVRLTQALPGPALVDNVSIAVKATDSATGATANGSLGYLVLPWALVLLLVLVVTGGGSWLWWRARRRRIHRGPGDAWRRVREASRRPTGVAA
ncbi:COG1470 family protein [Streptacidiphilus fuscans]|uniref:DUF916 domain-containing protein n=1 Tax=Streptacidiphilus fuscans TaxID=2789292 RepID=A0A931BCY2_9ACTN|nr:hypothetical protein [Streptacidiphilus fuscans]MBF9073276.1 hypothetical protein [Streptacidiphilus fuscans]